ncbi:methyltransferase domain-containing protein [Bernardetia sp. ABR2-2B]|uniref:methyltransferase domain-containing protein n=1 Tax=Bernardetia sp. ABR2-2B TaxID=3127472 RepID=UPI0030D152E3
MKTTLISSSESLSFPQNQTENTFSSIRKNSNKLIVENSSSKNYENLISYYQKATEDYKFWSENYHMHFGFYKTGMNPFDLEKMLLQMTKEVFERLEIPKNEEYITKTNQEIKAIDLGCGVGTSARYFAQKYPFAKITAVTLVQEQIELGKYLLKKEIEEGKIQNQNVESNINFFCTDYTNTPFANESFTSAYAIESSCYGNGKDKSELLEEASRLLKKGGKLVIADGFLKHGNELPFLVEKAYNKTCECWALSEMGQINPFVKAMEKASFTDIKVEDISWKVAPSVAHVPYITLKFLLKQFNLKSVKNLNQERKNNVFAPLMTMFLGLARNHFSYYIVSATKK